MNQNAHYQRLFYGVKEIINNVFVMYPIWPIFLLAVYQSHPIEMEKRKEKNILFGSLLLSKQPKSFILFVQSLHLIVLAFLFVQLHLLAEQSAKEAVNCALLPCPPIL